MKFFAIAMGFLMGLGVGYYQWGEVGPVIKINIMECDMDLQKKPKWRNKNYTDWVKSQPSCISGRPADDPHHIKGHGFGGSVKAPDWATIPLTRDEHDLLHNVGWRRWEEVNGSQLEHVARTLGEAVVAISKGELKL